MILSAKTGLTKSIKQWKWLVDNPECSKGDYFNKKKLVNPIFDCYLCDYVEQSYGQSDEEWNDKCKKCLLYGKWGDKRKSNICTNNFALFGKWEKAIFEATYTYDFDKAHEYAVKILERLKTTLAEFKKSEV